MSSQTQTEEFKQAAKKSNDLKARPTNDELLQLYALYKQGIHESIEKSPTPSAFDMKGKAKRKAWQKVVDEGVTPEEAQKRYVELVDRLLNTYGDKSKDSAE